LVTSEVTFGVCLVKVVSVVQRLVYVASDMHEVPGHECSLEGDLLEVGGEHPGAVVDDFEGVDVELEFVHALQGVFGVIGASSVTNYMLVK